MKHYTETDHTQIPYITLTRCDTSNKFRIINLLNVIVCISVLLVLTTCVRQQTRFPSEVLVHGV